MGKTFVLGDIHGGYKALLQVLKKSGFDKKNDTLISLGDICDGWSQVYECVEELLTIENLILLRANHDEWFLDYIKRYGKHPQDWAQGGLATKKSYERNLGVEYLNPIDIPTEHVRLFYSAHLYYIDDKNRMFVHGGWDRNFLVKDLKSSDPQDFYWNRALWEKALTCKQGNLKTADGFDEIFIGHSATINWQSRKEEIVKTADGETRVVKKKRPIDYPMYSAGVWNLDTGGGFDGRLTIMDVDTKEFWQSDLVNELYSNEINLK